MLHSSNQHVKPIIIALTVHRGFKYMAIRISSMQFLAANKNRVLSIANVGGNNIHTTFSKKYQQIIVFEQ